MRSRALGCECAEAPADDSSGAVFRKPASSLASLRAVLRLCKSWRIAILVARRGCSSSRRLLHVQLAAQMPLADRPAPQILQLTLTPTSGSSLATKIALHIGPASGSAVPTVATDALTLQVVASGPSSVAVVFGEPPKIPLQAKASPAGAAPPPRGRTSLFEGFLAFLGLQSCFQ